MPQTSMEHLRIFFQDDDTSEIVIPIPACGTHTTYSLRNKQSSND